nr:hypothetical protein [Tanacetum cinerariifolium]
MNWSSSFKSKPMGYSVMLLILISATNILEFTNEDIQQAFVIQTRMITNSLRWKKSCNITLKGIMDLMGTVLH